MFPRISWSSLLRFEQCEQRYGLTRRGFSEDLPASLVAVGSAVHAAAYAFCADQESLESVGQFAVDDLARRLAEARQRGDWSVDDSLVEDKWSEAREIASKVCEALALRRSVGSVWASEVKLVKYLQGWSLEAVVDLFERLPSGELWLWDVKTGKRPPDVGQLVFYDVVCRTLGWEPDGVGWLDREGCFRPVEVSSDMRLHMRERIRRAVEAIAGGDLVFSGFPSECQRCRSARWCPRLDKAREAARS